MMRAAAAATSAAAAAVVAAASLAVNAGADQVARGAAAGIIELGYASLKKKKITLENKGFLLYFSTSYLPACDLDLSLRRA